MSGNIILRPLEEMIEKWRALDSSLIDKDKFPATRGTIEALHGCADELASALPEIERLLGERLAAMRGVLLEKILNEIDTNTGRIGGFVVSAKTFAEKVILIFTEVSDEQADKWQAEHDKEVVEATTRLVIRQLTSEFSMGAPEVTEALTRHDRELTKRVLEPLWPYRWATHAAHQSCTGCGKWRTDVESHRPDCPWKLALGGSE